MFQNIQNIQDFCLIKKLISLFWFHHYLQSLTRIYIFFGKEKIKENAFVRVNYEYFLKTATILATCLSFLNSFLFNFQNLLISHLNECLRTKRKKRKLSLHHKQKTVEIKIIFIVSIAYENNGISLGYL